MTLFPHEPRFLYKRLERIESPGGRKYLVDTVKVPSVTTILDRTKDKQKLVEWEARIGTVAATQQKERAAHVGTNMHETLECILENKPLTIGQDWESLRGHEMAFRLANSYFQHITTVFGTEVGLHYDERYAGTTDLVAVYRGKLAIVDFKQSVKPKRHEYITDYFHQLAAYALAHDRMYGTEIKFGAVLIAVQDGTTQEFTTTGPEFESFKAQWWKRVTEAERCLGTSN